MSRSIRFWTQERRQARMLMEQAIAEGDEEQERRQAYRVEAMTAYLKVLRGNRARAKEGRAT